MRPVRRPAICTSVACASRWVSSAENRRSIELTAPSRNEARGEYGRSRGGSTSAWTRGARRLAPGEVCGALAVRRRTRWERSGVREDFATIADVGSEAVGPPRSAPAAPSAALDALRLKFDRLMARMQEPAARTASDSLFVASGEELAGAALRGTRAGEGSSREAV